jgi:hypothetical protein
LEFLSFAVVKVLEYSKSNTSTYIYMIIDIFSLTFT